MPFMPHMGRVGRMQSTAGHGVGTRRKVPYLASGGLPFPETNRQSYRIKEWLLAHYHFGYALSASTCDSYITLVRSNPLHLFEYGPESMHVCILAVDTALVTILGDSSSTWLVRAVEPDLVE